MTPRRRPGMQRHGSDHDAMPWALAHKESAEAYLDLDCEFSCLVDAQLLLRLLGVMRNLQLIQQIHLCAVVEQDVDAYASQKR